MGVSISKIKEQLLIIDETKAAAIRRCRDIPRIQSLCREYAHNVKLLDSAHSEVIGKESDDIHELWMTTHTKLFKTQAAAYHAFLMQQNASRYVRDSEVRDLVEIIDDYGVRRKKLENKLGCRSNKQEREVVKGERHLLFVKYWQGHWLLAGFYELTAGWTKLPALRMDIDADPATLVDEQFVEVMKLAREYLRKLDSGGNQPMEANTVSANYRLSLALSLSPAFGEAFADEEDIENRGWETQRLYFRPVQ